MTASYPGSIKTFTVKVDGVDTIYAADINSLQEEIVAIETDLISELKAGWIPLQVTCTYALATAFTVPGNLTTMFTTGMKLRLVQSGVTKYFYVVGSSYSSVTELTTVTITGGSDYSLTNTAISSPKISHATTPQGFPGWFNWAPTLTGYSSVPTNAVYRFSIDGRKVHISVREVTSGISNATSITISLPVTAATITNQIWMYPASYENNGVASTTWGRGVISSGDNKIVFGISPAQQDGFTASGNKRISAFDGWYEF